MEIKAISKSKLRGKRILVRADFDVPVKNGMPMEDFRIKQNLPTIKYILKNGGLVRIIAHLDRPSGRVIPSLSLAKFAGHLSGLLGRETVFIKDPLNEALFQKYNFSGDIILFENIRFWPGEEKNDMNFAKKLAQWGDIYVNENFATSHRKHASFVSLPKFLPSYAGLYLEKEISTLNRLLKNPKRPFVAILGGAKLETKMPLVKKFLKLADRLLIAGALANTIYYLRGLEIGKSTADRHFKINPTIFNNKKIFLPFDVLVADKIKPGAKRRISEIAKVGRGDYIVDIGPESVKKPLLLLKGAKTIVWNGPLGFAEIPEFSKGTIVLAKALQKIKAFKVIGGGDTVAALGKYKMLKGFNHVSTGGGAMLEFLAGKKLPGIEALKK